MLRLESGVSADAAAVRTDKGAYRISRGHQSHCVVRALVPAGLLLREVGQQVTGAGSDSPT